MAHRRTMTTLVNRVSLVSRASPVNRANPSNHDGASELAAYFVVVVVLTFRRRRRHCFPMASFGVVGFAKSVCGMRQIGFLVLLAQIYFHTYLILFLSMVVSVCVCVVCVLAGALACQWCGNDQNLNENIWGETGQTLVVFLWLGCAFVNGLKLEFCGRC